MNLLQQLSVVMDVYLSLSNRVMGVRLALSSKLRGWVPIVVGVCSIQIISSADVLGIINLEYASARFIVWVR